jgi:hypothetical protein
MLHVQPEESKNLSLPCPPFGKSDHNSILLIPAYKQKLKQGVQVSPSIWKWSDETDAKLQECFNGTNWTMFRDSSDGIEENTTSVTGFINKCIDDIIPTLTVCTYPNQKPWITGNIRTELKSRAAASKSGTKPDANKKNPVMPSDEPSNRQSINTGLRSNHTTPAPTLVGCGRACKPLQTTKESTAESCPVTRAYQTG